MAKINDLKEFISDLIARLPELEWKLSNINPFLLNKSVPKHLFRVTELTAAYCISELKLDIQALEKQKHERSAEYLAEQLKRKISILVGLCRIEQKKKAPKDPGFGITMLTTRQQWLRSLEQDVHVLAKQQEALAKTLNQMQINNTDVSTVLNLKSELGEVERRLTLAQEGLNKATSI